MAEKQKQIMTYQVERRNVSTRDWNYKLIVRGKEVSGKYLCWEN